MAKAAKRQPKLELEVPAPPDEPTVGALSTFEDRQSHGVVRAAAFADEEDELPAAAVMAETFTPAPPPTHEDPDDPDEDENRSETDQQDLDAGVQPEQVPAKIDVAEFSPERSSGEPLEGEIIRGHGEVRYESRITIVDAWQYPGSMVNAPDWVDRNWVAYGDWDPVRNIEPGPALRVPDLFGGAVMCRKGDYVARQETRFTADTPGEIRVEVWEEQQFQRLFMPV